MAVGIGRSSPLTTHQPPVPIGWTIPRSAELGIFTRSAQSYSSPKSPRAIPYHGQNNLCFIPSPNGKYTIPEGTFPPPSKRMNKRTKTKEEELMSPKMSAAIKASVISVSSTTGQARHKSPCQSDQCVVRTAVFNNWGEISEAFSPQFHAVSTSEHQISALALEE